jgi:hypothetical protein
MQKGLPLNVIKWSSAQPVKLANNATCSQASQSPSFRGAKCKVSGERVEKVAEDAGLLGCVFAPLAFDVGRLTCVGYSMLLVVTILGNEVIIIVV